MALLHQLKIRLVGKALEKCKDPFEEGRVIVMFNFCLVMLLVNIPYTIISLDHFIGHLISGIVQISFLLIALIWLNRGFSIKVATNVFFAHFILQYLYHFTINNGAVMVQGILFLVLLALFAFFLYGRKVGWITFVSIVCLTIVGIYNTSTEYSLFRFPDELADPTTKGDKQYIIILPLILIVYLVSEFVGAQQKAKKQIFSQNRELKEKNQEINDSINYAKRIQKAILPSQKLIDGHLPNSFIIYKPKDIVAGDFYWLESVGDTVYFAVADCTGHGVPGAMVSVICNGSLNRAVNEFNLKEPGSILDKTRELVIKEFEKSDEEVQDGMDIAFVSLGQSESESGERKLLYAGAHNPLWIVSKRDSHAELVEVSDRVSTFRQAQYDTLELIEIKANKQPIGMFDHPEPFTTHEVVLNQGDSIYIFSDGYADQFGGEKGKKYKSGKLKQFLLSIHDKDMTTQKQLLSDEFESWKGDTEQVDDVCIIGVRV